MGIAEFAESLRVSRSSVAVGQLTAAGIECAILTGKQTVDEHTLFDVGSISKTVTATILAELVLAGTVRLTTTLGELLPEVGGSAGITLGQLATHTSGLPRLAPNWKHKRFDARDPYAGWGVDDLLDALASAAPTPSREAAYSNFGFQALGHALTVATGTPVPKLSVQLLRRAGCSEVRCSDEGSAADTIPGYRGWFPVRTWSMNLYGPGGVRMSVRALMQWAAAQTQPGTTELEEAVRLTQRPVIGDQQQGRGLAWVLNRGRIWHNGGTAAHSAELFIQPGIAAVGAVTNNGKADLQRPVVERLVEIVAAN